MTIDPRIVGIWQLKGTMGRNDDGKVLEPPYGPLAMGLVTFQADGYDHLAITEERSPGVVTSSNDPIASGSLA